MLLIQKYGICCTKYSFIECLSLGILLSEGVHCPFSYFNETRIYCSKFSKCYLSLSQKLCSVCTRRGALSFQLLSSILYQVFKINAIIYQCPRNVNKLDVYFIHAEKYSELYAFHYKPKEGELVKQSSGWALFDSQNEYNRMGVPNELWRSTSLNSEYEVCTYCVSSGAHHTFNVV